jgi:hypothetical protein
MKQKLDQPKNPDGLLYVFSLLIRIGMIAKILTTTIPAGIASKIKLTTIRIVMRIITKK